VITLNLTVLAPINGVLSSDTSICPGSSITLEATGGSSYLWSTGETTSIIIVTPSATTTYSATITGNNGCSISKSVIVSLFNAGSVTITGNPQQFICTGSSLQLNASGSTTYIWSPITGLNNPNIPNPIANPSLSTTYTVIGISSDGCQSTDTIRLEVIEPTPLTFSSISPVCGNNAPIQLQAVPAGGIFSGTGVTSGYFDPSTTGPGVFSVQYLYINLYGCSSTLSQNIEVLPLPLANAGPDQTICQGSLAILSASGGEFYLWSDGETTATIQVSPTTTTTYSMIVTNAAGCSDTDYVTVNVNPLPAITYIGNPSVCQGNSSQITLSGASNYIWSPAAGLSNPNAFDPVLSPISTTTYTITGIDSIGCYNTIQIIVVVKPPFIVDAGADRVFCGTPVALTATAGIQGANFRWSNGTTGASNTVSPSQTTSYLVTATSPEGCSYSDSVTVYVPYAYAGNRYNICRGGSIRISGNIAQYPLAGILQYSWTPSTGLSNPNIANPIASPTSTTTYTLTITTPEGCRLSATTSVVISPTPEILLGSDLSLARGSTIQLTPALRYVQPGRILSWTYIGNNPNGSLNLSSIPNPTFTAGSVSVATTTFWILRITNTNGCSGSDTIAITVDPALSGFVLSGSLRYDNAFESQVNDGWAYLIHSSGAKDSVSLSPSGSFLFVGLQNGNYRLTTMTNKTFGGITTADASLINTYALGFGGLNGLKLKAADVTSLGNIPSSGTYVLGNDAQQTARRAADLSINNSFDRGGPGNWYHDTVNVVINNQNPQQNIKTISFGDVNASYSPVLRRESLLNIEIQGVQFFEPSRELLFPITPMENINANSFQFEMELPEGFELIKAHIPGINEPLYLSQKGRKAMVGWYSVHGLPIEFKSQAAMLILSFKGSNDANYPNSPIFLSFLSRSEIANQAGEELNANLSIPHLRRKTNPIGNEFALFPNPVSPGETLNLHLPANLTGYVSLFLNDGLGRQVASLSKFINFGQNVLELPELGILSPGKFTLHVVSEEHHGFQNFIAIPLIVKF
jgi:hypothetical protein